MLGMDSERAMLGRLTGILADATGCGLRSHIQPLVVGDPRRAVRLSEDLAKRGFKALPIRVPTVPPGTDRLRFSLSAAIKPEELAGLGVALAEASKSISQ